MRKMTKSLSLLGIVGGVVATFVYLSFPADVARAVAPLVLDVAVDGGSFNIEDADGDGAGAFFIRGDIVDEDEGVIGEFLCWGWAIDEAATATYVSQEYTIDGRGAIQVQGQEIGGDGRIGVVGGTGDFRNVRGEGVFGDFVDGFSISFNLRG